MDAAHFVQADLVDFVRRQVRCRNSTDIELVPRFAVRNPVQADRFPGGRQILVTHEVFQPLVGRDKLVLDRIPVRGGQSLAIRLAEVPRHISDRTIEAALLGTLHDLRLYLRNCLLHQDARLHDALAHALAHVQDRLIDVDDEIVDAAQEIVIVLDCSERMQARTAANLDKIISHRPELVDRLQVARKAFSLDGLLALESEEFVADAVVIGQTRGVDLQQPPEEFRVERVGRRAVLGADGVGQPVVIPIVADRRCAERIQLQRTLEILVE